MRQELTPEHRTALIEYRFERAYQTLEEADYMVKATTLMQQLIVFTMLVSMLRQDSCWSRALIQVHTME